MKEWHEPIAAQRSHEFGIDPRIALQVRGDPGTSLNLMKEMPERTRPKAVQALDEALAA